MDTTDIYFIPDIYEISIGRDPMTDYRFTVGKKRIINGKELTVSQIVQNSNALITHGTTRVEIYVKDEDGNEFLWKTSENQPIMITSKI